MIMIFSLTGINTVNGQILKDTVSLNNLKDAVDCIYNLRFDKAQEISEKLRESYPRHPVIYLLNAMIIYWENYPVIPTSPISVSFEENLRKCIALCEEDSDPDDFAEYLLANLGARGMLLEYLADNDLSDKVFSLAKSTYRFLRQSFNYTSSYYDFYFFTGLYNYYREAYPDAHPVYKVIAFIFPKGDIEKGLDDMHTAAEHSIMLKAESLFFLSYIYVNYENNYQKASVYSKALTEISPGNLEYRTIYIRNLMLLKKYDEAEIIIRSSEKIKMNSFFRAKFAIFDGIIQEKKYHRNDLAENFYNEGINSISEYGYFGNEYKAYALFGLSRLSDMKGDKHNKKTYRKKAMDISNFRKINFDE